MKIIIIFEGMSIYKKHCSGDGGSKHANLGIGTDFVQLDCNQVSTEKTSLHGVITY